MELSSALMVREMVERVIELTRIHAIWWELVNKENFGRHSTAISRHDNFFAPTAQALFLSFTVVTHQLFEGRKKVISLVNLTRELETSNPTLQDTLMKDINAHRRLLRKVSIIRSNIYTHRSETLRPAKVFVEVDLAPNEMASIVHLSQRMVVALAVSAGIEDITDMTDELACSEEYAAEDTRRILDALNEWFVAQNRNPHHATISTR